ncbi:MAG: efflux transporter outer membrane subunit [Bryobacteraceae bacterium]
MPAVPARATTPPGRAESVPPEAKWRFPGRAFVLAAALQLCACTMVGPDFVRPKVPWLGGWSSEGLRQAGRGEVRNRPATDEWWRNFNDEALDRLVAEAQVLNLDVRTAGMRILEARAELGIARSGLYPQLQQLSASALRTGTRSSSGPPTALWAGATSDLSPPTALWAYGAGYDVAWELDFWGKYRRGIEAACAGYFASVAQYDDVQVLVAAQAASLYGSIRTVELRLRIAEENAALQKRILEITELLFRSGNDSELDVQQARTQYLTTLATIPELETALRQAQNALCVLLARPPGPLPEMQSGRGTIPEAALDVIVDIPADLLRRRPDVRAVELQLAAQSALIGVNVAALYPSISLTGLIGLSATSIPSVATMSWAMGPALVWNIPDYGRLKNQVLVQDARFQQIYEQYQATVLSAARELDDAAVSFANGRIQIDILRDSVQAARRSLDIAMIQYREGLVDFQRVLDSQRALFNQQEAMVATQGGILQSLITVYKALGGGWRAGRTRPFVDDAPAATMGQRRGWKNLLQEPLPPPGEKSLPLPRTDKP